MSALYIGRFQPFHLGHLDAVEQILEKEDFVIIAIGSAEDSHLPENPFTASQRYEMIEAALQEKGIPSEKYTILPVRNINNYALWPAHVISLCPAFETVYTGSTIVETLFKKHSDKKVCKLAMRKDVSGTKVRALIKAKKPLKGLVSEAVLRYLVSIEAHALLNHLEPDAD